jgi:hypothetical protein
LFKGRDKVLHAWIYDMRLPAKYGGRVTRFALDESGFGQFRIVVAPVRSADYYAQRGKSHHQDARGLSRKTQRASDFIQIQVGFGSQEVVQAQLHPGPEQLEGVVPSSDQHELFEIDFFHHRNPLKSTGYPPGNRMLEWSKDVAQYGHIVAVLPKTAA